MQEKAVSILARHCWRARSSCCSPLATLRAFQSSPAIAGGRDSRGATYYHERRMFQSSPAIAGGRDREDRREPKRVARRFNPRPPLLAGAILRVVLQAEVGVVSILARHCWRARYDDCLHTARQRWPFQSSPAIAGGRDVVRLRGFASHPGVSILARHCWRAR